MLKALKREWGKMGSERILAGLNGLIRMAEKQKTQNQKTATEKD
jgi:hypothetical protein